jgi:hypothetical protein
MKKFLLYFWNTIAHPKANVDALAEESTVRWAIGLAALPVAQVWGNMALHWMFGLDWLGTRPLLADPTFVGGFGYWRVNLATWVPAFAALMPLLALTNLVVNAGVAHLASKPWGGQGTYEQMVNAMTFAFVVPNVVIGGISEWVFSVPTSLVTGHPYWWTAAMQGEFGPVVGAVWNVYVLGVYIGLQWAWMVVLGSIAIRRIQRVPAGAAMLTATVTFAVSMSLSSVFVR